MNKIEQQFVTYEIALELKEIGFDEEVIALYDTEFVETKCKLNIFAFTIPNKGIFEEGFKKGWCIKAPLWSQVFQWLRDKYQIHVVITVNPYSEWENFNGYKIYGIVDGELRCVSNNETQSWEYNYAQEQAILRATILINKTQTNGK